MVHTHVQCPGSDEPAAEYECAGHADCPPSTQKKFGGQTSSAVEFQNCPAGWRRLHTGAFRRDVASGAVGPRGAGRAPAAEIRGAGGGAPTVVHVAPGLRGLRERGARERHAARRANCPRGAGGALEVARRPPKVQLALHREGRPVSVGG
eukprot:1463609-Rhodomonas_salina.1